MPEREFKILITGDSADLQGQSKQGAGALKEVTKETQKSSEANEEHHKSFLHMESSGRLFHKVLHEITEASPALGLALRLALSPQGAAIFGVVLALHQLKQAHEEAQKAAEDSAKESADDFNNLSENASKLAIAAAEAASKFAREFEELARQQASAKAQTDNVINSIEAEKAAVQKLLAARENYELSQTTDPIAKMDIKRRYGDLSQQEELRAAESIIGAKQRELDNALARRAKLQADTAAAVSQDSGPGGASRRDDLDAREKDRVRLEKQIEQFGAIANKLQGGDITKWTAAVEKLDQAKIALQETLRIKAEDERKASEAAAEVERARKAELENEAIIQQRKAELPGLKERFGLQQATSAAESAFGGLTDLHDQIPIITKKITESAGTIDLAGFLEAVQRLSMLPAKTKILTDAINSATAGVDDALRTLDSRIQGVETKVDNVPPTRTLPGGG